MEQNFSNNSIDLQILQEFCEREGEAVTYRKGDQMERQGDPARWLAFVTEGCFKYVTYGISEDKGPIKREPSSSLEWPSRDYRRQSQRHKRITDRWVVRFCDKEAFLRVFV